jgi:MFS family permease
MRKLLLSLYPEAWRERYGEEMAALLDATPPSITGALDLLRGAVDAHLRPRVRAAPAVRARGTIAQVLGCFIVFCAVGLGFAKTIENTGYRAHVHPLLGISHSVIVIATILAAGALALAAAPLALAALAQARRTREPALVRLIAVPPVAIASFAGSVGLLALWRHAHHHGAGLGGWLLVGLCVLCAGAGGFACWAAPRAIMRRIDVPRRAFAFSVPAAGLVAFGMAAAAVATGVFLVGIVADAPQVGASGNGPGQLIDVTASIALQFIAMLGLSAVAAVSVARGRRSVRHDAPRR